MSEIDILKEAVSGDLDGLLDKAEDENVEKYEDGNPEQFNSKRTTMKEGESDDEVEKEMDDEEQKKMGRKKKDEDVDKMPMDDENKKMGRKRKAEEIEDIEKMEILAKGLSTTLAEVKKLSEKFDALEEKINSVQKTAGEALQKADNTTITHSAFDDLNTTLGTQSSLEKRHYSEEEKLWKGVMPAFEPDLHI